MNLNRMRGIVFALIIGLVICFSSCDLNLCEESTDVNFTLGFYTMDGNRELDSVVQDLTIYGIGKEDILLYNQSVRQKIVLPLNPNADTTRFVIRIGTTEDVCTISHTHLVRLISYDCGFITEFDILECKHTNNNIDSISIIQPNVTNFEEEHVKIFL